MPKKEIKLLSTRFVEDDSIEVGVDEAGRGPMLGRVYAGAVVLPQDGFNHCDMKDSKRFHSEKKINATAEYIKENAIAWGVGWCSAEEIDSLNIRRATHRAMHKAISQVIDMLDENSSILKIHLLVDGNDFTPMMRVIDGNSIVLKTSTIEGGDDKFTSIAAASILAKVDRDAYIESICNDEPELDTRYNLRKNKGYGTKQHMDGIREHGITKHHRKTFGLCKHYV